MTKTIEHYKKEYVRPIPFAVLKIQLKRLVEQQSERGVIFTKDLINLIDQYEVCEQVVLLTTVQKKAILPYTKSNPDLEMTPDDILNLLKLVCPSPSLSLSAPTSQHQQPTSPPPPVLQHSHQSALNVVRPRTSPPLKSNHSSGGQSDHAIPWKRRPSAVASSIQDRNELDAIISSPATVYANRSTLTSTINEDDHQQSLQQEDTPILSPGIKDDESKMDEEYSNGDLARYYRRSLKLTQRLKSSERSLASMARDNEDRIVELQNRVDDMNLEVVRQRKEIQEYKGKEKNSLEQISALESHISNIQRSETDQKQVYLSIKTLFDEKCQETQKLQDLLRQKESDLEKTEDLLNSFQQEVQLLSEERKRLLGLQNSLELELETSAQAHKQLAEQKTENEKLKEIIDSLKTDLDEALYLQKSKAAEAAAADEDALEFMDALEVNSEEEESSHALVPASVPLKTLEVELVDEVDERLKSVRDEKDYYKSRATEAKEDLDRVKSELDYLRRALDQENRSLVNELRELRLKTKSSIPATTAVSTATETADAVLPLSDNATHIDTTTHTTTSTINNTTSPTHNTIPTPTEIIINSIDIPDSPVISDVWSSSRIRQRSSHGKAIVSSNKKKQRTVQDLHERSSSTAFIIATTNKDRKMMTRKDDKIVTNTVTFALYTVLIYFFGIVTSTFLMDGSGSGQPWDLVAVAASGQVVPKSKILEIVLYWLEKLLFEPQGLPVS